MTQRDSGQSFDPKHRIIGAVVIVALAVVLVPMILGEREPPLESSAESPAKPAGITASAAGQTPDADTKVAVTVVTPAVKSKTPKPDAPAVPVAAAPVAPATEPAKEPPQESIKTAATKPVTVAKAPAKVPAAPVTNGWVVQVGTFSNADNATRVEEKLRALGQTVRAERVTLDNGKAVRVRVGPFADKVAALKAQDRIQKETGIKVVVLAYP
jgi:DedD protein